MQWRTSITTIYAVLFSGVLLAHGAGADSELALGLFADGDWRACRRECRRVLADRPAAAKIRVLGAVCSLRLDMEIEKNIAVLADAADNKEIALPLRSLAAYECGREHWRAGRIEDAFERLRFAYRNADDDPLFLRAGCSLYLLMNKHKDLRKTDPALTLQLQSTRNLYDWQLQMECALADRAKETLLGKPGEWIVAFYRTQLAPAIGMRCSCVPSCSEYFRRACRKHGLLGFPLQADRFFREPTVVQQARNPVEIGAKTKYADPLNDHDFWFDRGDEQ